MTALSKRTKPHLWIIGFLTHAFSSRTPQIQDHFRNVPVSTILETWVSVDRLCLGLSAEHSQQEKLPVTPDEVVAFMATLVGNTATGNRALDRTSLLDPSVADRALDRFVRHTAAAVGLIPAGSVWDDFWLPLLDLLLQSATVPRRRYARLLLAILREYAVKTAGPKPTASSRPADSLARTLPAEWNAGAEKDAELRKGYRFLRDGAVREAVFKWDAIQRERGKHLWEGTGVVTQLDGERTLRVWKVGRTEGAGGRQREVAWGERVAKVRERQMKVVGRFEPAVRREMEAVVGGYDVLKLEELERFVDYRLV